MNRAFLLLPLAVVTACSSSSSNGGGGDDASSDAAEEASMEDAAPNDAASNDATVDAVNDINTGAMDVVHDVTMTNDATADGGTSEASVDAANDVATTVDASDGGTSSSDASGDANDGGSSGGPDASADASDGAAAPVTLTVNDYLNWCNVTVNGVGPSTANPQHYTLPLNSSVTVQGDTADTNFFYWGYWGNVGADGGLVDGGEDLSKTVTFTITRDMTLNACCPDNGQPLSQCTF